ncbi:P80 family lipoprotein [Mycoplasmoides fastidiosum]|uniref:P80 family lipoprotein n=1 Tax=Mycoplasmoides fastidiosum TaxID=92758 RepID=UPI0021154C98|nr:P80 family lipoprotein [Mycoplasmoides fastidiosum]UUD37764.1 P80 family lipoprotein [Mycoplasmoides fastidiosum]
MSSLILAACGGGVSRNQDEIVLGLPWDESDRRVANLQRHLDNYKAELDKNPEMKAQGYLPVRITTTPGSYGVFTRTLSSNLNVGNESAIPNLTLNYPALVSVLAQRGRQLDFNVETTPVIGKKVTFQENNQQKSVDMVSDKFDTNLISSEFLKINSEIRGVETDKNNVYLLPVGVSSEILYLSKPVLNYLLNEALKNGASTTSGGNNGMQMNQSDAAWFKSEFGVEKSTSTTVSTQAASTETAAYTNPYLNEVKNIYGEFTAGTNNPFSNYTLKKEVFANFDDLMDLMDRLAKAFPLKQSTDKSKPTRRLISLDSVESYLYSYSFNKLNHDYSKYLWNKPQGAPITDEYNFPLFKQGTEQYNALKTAYDKLQSISANGGYDYSETPNDNTDLHFVNLRVAVSMSSNSRWTRKTSNDSEAVTKKLLTGKDVLAVAQPLKNTASENTKFSYILQGGNLVGVDGKSEKQNRATRLFAKWFFEHAQTLNKENKTYNVSPSITYGLDSSYVPSVKSFYENSNNKELLTNPAVKSAFDLFKSASTDSKYVSYTDPASEAVDTLRTALKSNLLTLLRSHNGALPNFEEYLKAVGSEGNLVSVVEKAKS